VAIAMISAAGPIRTAGSTALLDKEDEDSNGGF